VGQTSLVLSLDLLLSPILETRSTLLVFGRLLLRSLCSPTGLASLPDIVLKSVLFHIGLPRGPGPRIPSLD